MRPWPPETARNTRAEAAALAVEFFRVHVANRHDEIIADLGGRDLACWCGPDDPCHADVLLQIANPA